MFNLLFIKFLYIKILLSNDSKKLCLTYYSWNKICIYIYIFKYSLFSFFNIYFISSYFKNIFYVFFVLLYNPYVCLCNSLFFFPYIMQNLQGLSWQWFYPLVSCEHIMLSFGAIFVLSICTVLLPSFLKKWEIEMIVCADEQHVHVFSRAWLMNLDRSFNYIGGRGVSYGAAVKGRVLWCGCEGACRWWISWSFVFVTLIYFISELWPLQKPSVSFLDGRPWPAHTHSYRTMNNIRKTGSATDRVLWKNVLSLTVLGY